MIDNNVCYAQIIVKGNLTIPGNRPDIKTILRTTCTPSILKTITKNQHAIIFGELAINIEYAAKVPDETEPLYFVSFKTPFADIIKHFSPPDADNNYSIGVEYQDFCTLDERTISEFIILRAFLKNSYTSDRRCGPSDCGCCSLK